MTSGYLHLFAALFFCSLLFSYGCNASSPQRRTVAPSLTEADYRAIDFIGLRLLSAEATIAATRTVLLHQRRVR